MYFFAVAVVKLAHFSLLYQHSFLRAELPNLYLIRYLGLCCPRRNPKMSASTAERKRGPISEIIPRAPVEAVGPSTQFMLLSTAFFQPCQFFSRRCSGMDGLKVSRIARIRLNSSRSFQTPTARPAANAAPKAVVSPTSGRMTCLFKISD